MEPQVFKADPKEILASQRFKVVGFLSMFARRGGQALATEINDASVSKGDEIVIYDDHLEKKQGKMITEIYFKDITWINFTKSPSSKLLFFHINQGDKDTLIVGMENMDGLLASITAHLPPSNVAQQVMGGTFDGKAMARRMILTFVFLSIVYLIIDLLIRAHS
jgi:hypothetical protein